VKIETTIRKALLLRLATRWAPARGEIKRQWMELRKAIEAQVEGVLQKAGYELVESGGFRVIEGAAAYPDATVTLNLSVELIAAAQTAFRLCIWPSSRDFASQLEDEAMEFWAEIE